MQYFSIQIKPNSCNIYVLTNMNVINNFDIIIEIILYGNYIGVLVHDYDLHIKSYFTQYYVLVWMLVYMWVCQGD